MVRAAHGVGPYRTPAVAALAAFALSLASPAGAQSTAGFPPTTPTAQPAPAPSSPEAAQPAPPPAPPAPPPPTGPPPPVYQAAPPAYAQPAPPPPPAYGSQPAVVEPPPPPPPKPEKKGFLWPPPWSVRIDPFTAIFYGHLNLELEVGLLKWLSVEFVPQFVVNETPSSLYGSFGGWEGALRQKSNGWGPLSGTSIGAGFWLQGKPLEGYVLRAIFTNYAYTYESYGANGATVDSFSHTARVLMAMFGSNSTIGGVFTIAGGIGIGVDLNSEEHCYTTACDGGIELKLPRPPEATATPVVPVTSSFYPAVIAVRISFGVTFK